MASPDVDQLLQEATNPATLPERLEKIAEEAMVALRVQDARHLVLQAVASHPNTPPHLLAELLEEEPAGLAANPVLPLLLLEQPDFFFRISPWTLLGLLRQEGLPSACAAALTTHSDSSVAEAARMHIVLAGEASKEEWQTEIRSGLIRPKGNDLLLLLELRELGIAPPWVRDWLAGSDRAFLRRECLLSPLAPASPGMQGLRTAAHRATGSPDFACLEPDYDPTLSAQTLSHLAECGPWLRRAAARHPNTPADVLRQLAGPKQNRIVRGYVARNPSTPPDVLQAFAQDTDPALRIAVARNPALPEELQRVLAEDTDSRVRAMIARGQAASPHSPRPSRHEAKRSPRSSSGSGRPPFTKIPRERHQRIAAARDRRTPTALLEDLALTGDLRVCLALLSNPAAPPALLQQIADTWAAGLPDTEHAVTPDGEEVTDPFSDVLHSGTEGIIEVRQRIAAHPAVSADMLRNLAGDKAISVRRAARVAAKIRFPEDAELEAELKARARVCALEQANRIQNDSLLRFLAMTQPDTPRLRGDHLVLSDEWRDRLAAALNSGTTEAQLAQLAADGNRLVRAAARDRQRTLSNS